MTVLWTSDDAIAALDGTAEGGDWRATGISIDSRTVAKGDLFFAITGPRFDGHAFVASALTTIAAFFPLFMIGDIIGQIIFAIPAVVVCVLIASLVECFFVLPGHLRGALRSIDPQAEATTRGARLRKAIDDGFERFRSGPFNRAVTTALHYRWSTLAAAIAVLLISIGLLSGGRVGFNFFPSPESETIDANIRLAAGTPREKSNEALQQVLAAMERADEKLRGDGDSLVVMSLARIGQSQGDAFSRISGDHLGGVQVQLTPSDHRTVRTSEFVKAWRQEVPPIEGLERLGLNERRGGPPGRDLDLRLRGANVNDLLAAAEEAKAVFKQYAGVTDIKDDLPFGKQEIILELTPYGEALGLTTRNVANQVRGAFDGVIARRFARGDEEAEVRVQLPEDDATEAQIRALHVRSPQGEEIPLEEVVTFREDAGFARIRRENAAREVSVVANIDGNVTSAVDVVERMKASGEIAEIARRNDVQYRFAGKDEEQKETFADMQLGATIGLSAIYIILAWVFSSYAKPLVVMSIIPFGLVGAVWGHYLMGFNLSILSLVALLGLSGYPAYVTAKAGILGLTKALARELGSHNIRVNSLIPGWVMTERQKRLWVTPEALQECLDQQCLKTTISEADVANSALFLASTASAMITGQSLIIDGGRV